MERLLLILLPTHLSEHADAELVLCYKLRCFTGSYVGVSCSDPTNIFMRECNAM